MKRFNGTELAALALAAVLILGGASLVVWPATGPIHLVSQGASAGGEFSSVANMSTAESRACGITGMLLGLGLGAMIYRKNQ